MPVQTRVPRGVDATAICQPPPGAPWDIRPQRVAFKADTDQVLSFYVSARPELFLAGRERFSVKVVGIHGNRHRFTEAEYERVARMVGLPERPNDEQLVAEGVTVRLHEDGPEFMVEPGAAGVGAETADAWAQAVRMVLPGGVGVATTLQNFVPAENLQLQLPPGGADRLAGVLAHHPSVVIERQAAARPPAWVLASGNYLEIKERYAGIVDILSPATVESHPRFRAQAGPVRVSIELPWGSWTTAASVSTTGLERVELPTTVGVPPLRVALAEDLLHLAQLDDAGTPVVLGLHGDPPKATLVSLLERRGSDSAAVASPSASAAWAIPQPSRDGIFRLEGRQTVLFPLYGRSLAVDETDVMPRVEPLSFTRAPEWDLLIGAGQLQALNAQQALNVQEPWNLARRPHNELLRLAAAYALCARQDWTALSGVLPLGEPPYSLDEALLCLAAIRRGYGIPETKDLAMEAVLSAANAGRVPLLRWGVDLALTVLTDNALSSSRTVLTWLAAIAAVGQRLSPRSIWTAWTEN